MADNSDLRILSIINTLTDQKYNFKRTTTTGYIFNIFTKKSRDFEINHLLELFPDAMMSSKKDSIVLIKDTKIQLQVKPFGKQGIKSPGVDNEYALINSLKKIRKEIGGKNGVNFRFIGNNGPVMECEGVKSIMTTGFDTSNRKKADLILRGKRHYPISLKKHNAEHWESADSYMGQYAKDVIEKTLKAGKVTLDPIPGMDGILKLSKEIAWKASDSQSRDVVFGSDILDRGCVIQETFKDLQYEITDDDWINIKVQNLYKSISDVNRDSKHRVWFLIHNDKTRNSKTIGIKGVRVLAVYESRVANKSNIIKMR